MIQLFDACLLIVIFLTILGLYLSPYDLKIDEEED